jgi:hypothetical protein
MLIVYTNSYWKRFSYYQFIIDNPIFLSDINTTHVLFITSFNNDRRCNYPLYVDYSSKHYRALSNKRFDSIL